MFGPLAAAPLTSLLRRAFWLDSRRFSGGLAVVEAAGQPALVPRNAAPGARLRSPSGPRSLLAESTVSQPARATLGEHGSSPARRRPVYAALKRALDIIVAALALVIASPLLALAAVAVWLDSRGPVFFLQERVGKDFRPFRIYKLRTMATAPQPS